MTCLTVVTSALLLSSPLFAAVEPGGPTSPPRTDRFEYAFAKASDMDDFQALQGTWRPSAGSLTCTSKGSRDEIQWRRDIGRDVRVQVQILTGGRCGLCLRGLDGSIEVLFHRQKGVFEVLLGDEKVGEGNFNVTREPLTAAVVLTRGVLEVTAGGETPVAIALGGRSPAVTQLSLLSLRSQARFRALVVERPATGEAGPGEGGGARAGLSEDDVLLLERAEAAASRSEWDTALEILRKFAPEGLTPESWRDELDPSTLTLLNRVALHQLQHRNAPPFAALVGATRVVAQDGTVGVNLPFRKSWSAETPRLRRTDGYVVQARCAVPPVSVDIYRYDQQHQYWFGEEPRLQYVGGSSSDAIARARCEDQQEALDNSRLAVPPRRTRTSLENRKGMEYEIHFDAPGESGQDPRPMVQRELIFPSHGHTLQITIVGAPTSIEAIEDELAWILATLESKRR